MLKQEKFGKTCLGTSSSSNENDNNNKKDIFAKVDFNHILARAEICILV